MRWSDYGMPEVDAHASLRRSGHRRERVARHNTRRLRVRRATAPLAIVGFLVLMSAVTYGGLNTTLQLARIAVGFVLVMPFLATFDWLGEAER